MLDSLVTLGILATLLTTPSGPRGGASGSASASLQIHADTQPEQLGALLRARGWAHPDTRFAVRELASAHTGRALLLRETLDGIPIAGARVALRVDARGELVRTVGRSLAPGVDLERARLERRALRSEPQGELLWWPQGDRLVLARVIDEPFRWERGRPVQTRRYVALASGRELGRMSLINELPVSLSGWLENPLTTPEPTEFTVELLDQLPIELEDDVVRVLQCGWSEADEACAPYSAPVSDSPVGFPSDLPELTDTDVHADPEDPYAATQLAIHAGRLIDDLRAWGWDPYVWDDIDCSLQEVEPEDCRLLMHANVLQQDEQGVFPFAGAFYNLKRGIFMGQGINADTSFDSDIVVHEIGHHIVWGMGTAEPIDLPDDGARRRVDWGALNEGSADVFASLMGQNELIYDYFTDVEPGSYVDHRTRDIAIPFRCPENIVGEVHMEGRIWVSAIHTIRVELEAAGLASRDEFGAAWLTALALVRHIPRERGELFADSARALADELRLSFGPDAGDIADAVLGERGLLACEHVLDLHDELALPQGGDDPLDARFMVFTSYRTHVEAETVAAHPYAPPLQHRVTLGPDEGGVRLRARPTLWRPARPVEVGELDFTLGLLVSPGDGGVPFSRDPETKLTVNDAALRFESAGIDAEGWVTVEATGLTPGETYSLALVSLSPVDGDKYVIEHMRWELLEPGPAPEPAPETTGALETDGDAEGGTDSGGEGPSDGGCGCAAGEARGGAWWWLLTLALLPPRRRATARVSSRRGPPLVVPD